jgi:hypothetical protein
MRPGPKRNALGLVAIEGVRDGAVAVVVTAGNSRYRY